MVLWILDPAFVALEQAERDLRGVLLGDEQVAGSRAGLTSKFDEVPTTVLTFGRSSDSQGARVASTVDTLEHAVVPPREWWQRWAERRAAWWAERPMVARRWAKIRAIGLWVGLVWLLGLFIFVPEVRLGLRAWLGCLWVVIAWFLLMRTKTLSWTGYMRFFTVCIAWSVAIGVLSTWLATQVVDAWVGQDGPTVMIASITEETLKLVPLAVVALLAPRRVARFAASDWLLMGWASGTAFLLAEEALRRVAWATGNAGMFLLGYRDGGLPKEFTSFRIWPVPTDWSHRVEAFGGHGVVTAIIAAWVGLAVVAVRAVRTRTDRVALGVRVAAVVIPAMALWVAIADHAAYNGGDSYTTTDDGTPMWLDPATTNVPWWIRVPWSVFGHGHDRAAVLLALAALVLLVDGARLARLPAASLLPAARPGWVDGASVRARALTASWPRPTGSAAGHVAFAGAATAWVIGRDLRTALAAFAPQPGQARRAAAHRGATALNAQRVARELGYAALAEPVSTPLRRTAAGGSLLVLLIGALVLAPAAATDLDQVHQRWYWLAGVLQRVGYWWHDQPLGTQIAIGLGIAALIALSGGSLGLALGVSGVLTWGMDKSHGIATFVQDPNQATRNYASTITPAQLTADTLGVALTFAPGNFAGAAVGRGVRSVAGEVATDPATFAATRRASLQGEAGAVDPRAFAQRKPIELADGRPLPALSTADEAAATQRYQSYPQTHVKGTAGPAQDGQVQVYGHDERVISTSAGNVHPDGITAQYGALGDYKHVISEQTWHDPRTLRHPEMQRLATTRVDRTLGRLQLAADEVMGTGRGHVEITTNSTSAAEFIEGRMRDLGVRGYVRLIEKGPDLG